MNTNPFCDCADCDDPASRKAARAVWANDFPDPSERPGRDVVLYDASCRFCRESTRALARLDAGGRLSFLPLDDPRVARWYPDLQYAELNSQIHVVAPDGRRRKGARAVRYLTRRLPALWPIALAMHVPLTLPVWQWFYRQISRRRRLWNKGGGCRNVKT